MQEQSVYTQVKVYCHIYQFVHIYSYSETPHSIDTLNKRSH